MVYEKDNDYSYITTNIPFDYVISKTDLIIKVVKMANDNNFITDYIIYIMKNVIEKEGFTLPITYDRFGTIDYKIVYYENINRFYASLSKHVINKNLLFSFFCLFDPYEEDLTELIKISFKNLKNIFQSQVKLDNEEFFNEFINSFERISEAINKFNKNDNWRDIKDILYSFERYILNYLV
jgi:hypothetical protein